MTPLISKPYIHPSNTMDSPSTKTISKYKIWEDRHARVTKDSDHDFSDLSLAQPLRFSYITDKQNSYEHTLALSLCKITPTFLTKEGKPKEKVLPCLINLICNYRYQACRVCKDDPTQFLFRYSRGESKYLKNENGIGPYFIKFMDLLETLHFIDQSVQPKNRNNAYQSSFYFRKEFVEKLEDAKTRDVKGKADPLKKDPYYILKDKDFYPISYALPQSKKDKNKPKTLIPAKLTIKGVRQQIKTLTKYNHALNRLDFGFHGPENKKDQEIIRQTEFESKLYERRRVRRQFADPELQYHGRIYGGFWQRMPSRLRPLIKINGKDTIEIDFSSMHPSLLYHSNRINPTSEDLYKIPSSYPGIKYHDRDLIKKAFMRLVNSKNKAKFINGMRWESFQSYFIEIENHDPYNDQFQEELIKALEKTNYKRLKEEEYRKCLYQDLEKEWAPIWPDIIGKESKDWRHLTRLDSDIAMKVIKACLEEDIPILTIHDSFITTSHNKHRLKEIMGQSYRDTTKYTEAKIKIKCTIKGKEETKETI